MDLVDIAYDNPSVNVIVKDYYRIGEPHLNQGNYYDNSYNHATDDFEHGVSVITTKWLHSLKSVFFGAHDDAVLKKRGVYIIPGIFIGYGGDDEPVIYPTGYAKKTDISTYEELEGAIKSIGM